MTAPPTAHKPDRRGLVAARVACGVGLLFAAVSVYWGLGGRWLLDTVGVDVAERASDGGFALAMVAWGAAAAKTVAAALPLFAVREQGTGRRFPAVRVLSWVEAGILTTYGLVLTSAGLLVQAGAIDSTGGDHRALAWHAYLWDPWFLIWGLLVATALVQSRPRGWPQTDPADDTPERVAARR